jgi:hypothetical protein
MNGNSKESPRIFIQVLSVHGLYHDRFLFVYAVLETNNKHNTAVLNWMKLWRREIRVDLLDPERIDCHFLIDNNK